jgi:hypothetical protein
MSTNDRTLITVSAMRRCVDLGAFFMGEIKQLMSENERIKYINKTSDSHETALDYAIEHMDLFLVETLLESGADPNRPDSLYQKCATHRAVEFTREIGIGLRMIHLIREHGGRTDMLKSDRRLPDALLSHNIRDYKNVLKQIRHALYTELIVYFHGYNRATLFGKSNSHDRAPKEVFVKRVRRFTL